MKRKPKPKPKPRNLSLEPRGNAKCYRCGQEFEGGITVLVAHYQLDHPEVKLTP